MKNMNVDFLDVFKSSIISMILSMLFTIVFAGVLCFLELDQKTVSIINIILKSLSIILALCFGFKNLKNGLIKGLCVGCLFSFFTYIIYSLVNNDFSFSTMTIIDIFVCVLLSCVGGILVVNLKKD